MKNYWHPIEDFARLNEKVNSRYQIQNISIEHQQKDLLAIVTRLFDEPEKFEVSSFDQTSSQLILDYLYYSHELYLTKYIPEIERNIELLEADSNFSINDWLLLKVLFKDYTQFLEEHIEFENLFVFPYIQYLIDENKTTEQRLSSRYSNLSEFYAHHSDTEKDLKKIQSFLNRVNYGPSNKSILKIILNQIIWLERDLSVHSKIEEHVLIPRMIHFEQ